MLCQECTKKSTCKDLCPEAEKWVNRDYIPQKELLLVDIETVAVGISWGSTVTHITQTEYKILTLLKKHIDRNDIAYILDISKKSLRTHIYNLRTKGIIP